jgi:flagellar biosynthetic protein FlhB
MMTRQEMTEEHKESEGDPHFRAHRRQRGQEIAMNRMLRAVPEADVVLVNPTHYAVALKWNRKDGRAPVCIAKGRDEVAARIRERANAAGVPVHRDPPTARALHAALDIGDEIGREHYQAVAAAIRFAEAMRKKAGRMRR